jgi:energy-coupling factor transporter ATP-binding protein EcfA2
MKLRYLHLRDVPPLNDVAVTFGHEAVLARNCAIRFVIGVNGSGKTRFLQTLAEIFLHLESPAPPPFPVTLAYDLAAPDTRTGERTIYLRHDPMDAAGSAFMVFKDRLGDHTDWEDLITDIQASQPDSYVAKRYAINELPGSGTITAYLPSIIVAYTSGAIQAWEELFQPLPKRVDLPTENITADAERPVRWSTRQEWTYQAQQGTPSDAESQEEIEAEAIARKPDIRTETIGSFITPEDLKLVFLAVALDHAAREFREELATARDEARFLRRIDKSIELNEPMPGWRGLLNAVDFLYPVTISLRLSFQPERFDKDTTQQLAKLYESATTVLREPAGQPGRNLIFDLRRSLTKRAASDKSTAAALIEALRGERSDKPFDIFRRLKTWRQSGLLESVSIAVRKRLLPGLLLFDWLSDGERVFLGRMALLHLFRGEENALIILDEPETHFNDIWKRQIVDVIDDSLRDDYTEVIISTHSSIALTDVFDTEITLLRKDDEEGSILVDTPPIPTFGASPTEIMVKVFGAVDIVGQRANEFLDMILKVAAHPAQVESVWRMMDELAVEELGDGQIIKQSRDFKRLWRLVRNIHYYENDDRLFNVLRSVYDFTRTVADVNRVRVIDALRVLEDKLGPGHYRFEFNRRLQILESRQPRAS